MKTEVRERDANMLLFSSEEEGEGSRSKTGSRMKLAKSRTASWSRQDRNPPGILFFSIRTHSGTPDLQNDESLVLSCDIRLWWLVVAIIRTI